jgi:3-oxoadipate enol-lactonase
MPVNSLLYAQNDIFWMVRVKFFRVGANVLHFRLHGVPSAPKLVLANSLGTDARIWDAVIETLADHYRILSYDKRGHGLSDAAEGPYTLDDHVDDLLALAAGAGFQNFALAGISVGGLIAQRLAIREPGRVAALVLCDTAAKVGSEQMWNERIETVRRFGLAAISQLLLERWFAPDFRSKHPGAYAGCRNMLERTSVEGYVGTCASIRDADLTEQVCGIALPTLVIAGEEDRSTPPDLVRQTANRIPKARFETIPRAGHIPSIEAPQHLTALMQSYFTEVGHV